MYKNQRHSKGFTLLEIMIVVAIMGIIAASAWPSYDRYQQKSRRSDGIRALLENRAELEKCIMNYGSYTGDINNACDLMASNRGYYDITVVRATESYTLTATPQGVQAGDAECGNLTLSHLGQQTSSGTGPVSRCWSQ